MVSLYDISVPVFIRNLEILITLLKKASAHSGVSDEALVKSKLISDMGDLAFQIHVLTDLACGMASRAGKTELKEMPRTETNLNELQDRIQATIKVLKTVKEGDFVGEEEAISFTKGDLVIPFVGKTYIQEFEIPNHYFHFVTSYNLLRKEGIDIGKKDYLGKS
ncbi:hypothetical protein BGHDH14_bgh01293 [Blumeria hordei DH14]|uniref:DUF1993 domain-containing protein n=1 Tax=Blumeria graminis f. sp. hordei (strain DH14) TaxID=546991 RepID=N1JD57_BLUG1|nr:hypothetical protein BGHDH14_bgh01293 [Blumeria hordei DH14]